MAHVTCQKSGVWNIDDSYKKVQSSYMRYSGPASDPGCIFSWGQGTAGQLGNGSNSDCYSTVQVPGTNWATIKSGDTHALATKTNNSLWAWGCNVTDGRLGDNTRTDRNSPVQVPGSWCDAIGTRYASFGLTTGGALYGWGGIGGPYGTKSSPVYISGGPWCCLEASAMSEIWLRDTSNCAYVFLNTQLITPHVTFTDTCTWLLPGSWCKIVSKGYNNQHAAFGLRSNCTLWAWGTNKSTGTLGISFNYSSCRGACSPVQVPGLWCDVGMVGCGDGGFGLRTNGDLYCWGVSPVFLSSGWCCILPRSGGYGFVKCDGTQWYVDYAANTSTAAPTGGPWAAIEANAHTDNRTFYYKKI